MHHCQSMPPQWRTDARVLILGSMPGIASLTQQQYYAHPRNQFWSMLAALADQPLPDDFTARYHLAKNAGIAIWDVLSDCERQGSLDSAIVRHSPRPNALEALIAQLPQLAAIALNGKTAARYYRQYFGDAPCFQRIPSLILPSTSPAHAALSFDDKLTQWQQLRSYLIPKPERQ